MAPRPPRRSRQPATDARHARCSTAAWPPKSRAQQSWVFLSSIAARWASISAIFSPCSFAHWLRINCAGRVDDGEVEVVLEPGWKSAEGRRQR
eukprot:5974946-Prymnesium_polylepis.1